MMRAFERVAPIVPNVAVPRVVPGFPNAGWFQTLKNSVRNLRLTPSRSAVTFAILASHKFDPGPRIVFRPSVPKRERGAGEKAVGLRYLFNFDEFGPGTIGSTP